MEKRVVLGMSGGVDSSVAAYLLQKDGYEVIGANLVLDQAISHCTVQNESDARNVAQMLGIAYFSIDVSALFQERIIAYFKNEYSKGRTPNPCALCNREIKFKVLFEKANQLRAQHVATGHYAQTIRKNNVYYLMRSEDDNKDQSYFLSRLHRSALPHLIFPLGSFRKHEVIEIAKSAGLPLHEKDESQEICFVPKNDYRSFLADRFPELQKPGSIRNVNGEVIGTHDGIFLYTIGQRRGIEVPSSKPLYVLSIDPSENSITVGEEYEALQRGFRASSLNWLVAEEQIPETCSAKIRSQHTPAKVHLTVDGAFLSVAFEEPQMAITPGQLAAFYDGNVVLGSGWIE
jgi:tRNA-specific 2-thiouridylase